MTKIKMLMSRFHQDFPEGRLFKQIWLKGGYGGQIKLAKTFGITVTDVYRVRRRLGLPDLYSKAHPGYYKLMKRIKRMYLWEGKSTVWIGNALRIHPESVRKKLKAMGVKMRPDYVTNPLYFHFHKKGSHMALLKKIKELHEKGMTVRDIGKELGIDAGAVSTKLKAMGFEVWRGGGKRVPAGYPCAWCGTIMDYVNVSTGPRKQRYCSTRCVSQAKEFRKYLRGKESSYGREAVAKMIRNVESMPASRRRLVLEGIPSKQRVKAVIP